MNEGYDSTPETMKHIHLVQNYLTQSVKLLMERAMLHDQSKLSEPEKSIFDEYAPKLREVIYNSDEYKQYLGEMKKGLDHHYSNNPHHPEFWSDGIPSMSLLDIIEMLCDWKAATMRRADGDIRKSIEMNQSRFGYSDELKSILLNTVAEMGLEHQ